MPLADLPPPARRPPKRYWPSEDLPPYRYVPEGRHPHPTTDPAGHFRSRERGPAEDQLELTWMINGAWLYGVDLYNNWYFWEAHEVWEPLWHGLHPDSSARLFVQACMMCSAGMLKVHAADLDGVVAFWERAQLRFARACQTDETLFGLPTLKTAKAFRKYFGPAVTDDKLPALGRKVPRLILPM